MDTLAITRRYYALWLGVSSDGIEDAGVHFVYSDERNRAQEGYGKPFDIFAMKVGKGLTVSYGLRAAGSMPALRARLTDNPRTDEIAAAFEDACREKPAHGLKFVFESPTAPELPAKCLTEADYRDYLAFFRAVHPKVLGTDWVEAYFMGMAHSRLCWGIYEGGALASVAEAPDMPYMRGQVQEIGVNTRPECRNKGYVRAVCAASIQQMIASGICPMWSCAAGNEGSRRLAESLGFRHYGDFFTICLRDGEEK